MKPKIYTADEIAEFQKTHVPHRKVIAAQKEEAKRMPARRKRNKRADEAEQQMESAMLHGQDR